MHLALFLKVHVGEKAPPAHFDRYCLASQFVWSGK